MPSKLAYTQKFKATPLFPISAGQISYTFDPVDGTVVYKGEVTLPFGITKAIDKTDKVSPDALLSTHYNKAGEVLAFGDFKLTVTSLAAGNWAMADVSFKEAKGKAVLDVSGRYVKIHSLDASGSVFGFHIHLILTEV